MDIFDQQKLLKTFQIRVDTREQETPKAIERYKSFGCPWEKGCISYGDYTYNCTFPDGSKLFDLEETATPKCVVERKMSIDELANNLINRANSSNRDRFKREFERASSNGARIYLLVENASWEKIYTGSYRCKIHPNALSASIQTWMVRYNANLIFCKDSISGRLIKEILYRDFKERVERGEYGGKFIIL